jgi:hypothetical protein
VARPREGATEQPIDELVAEDARPADRDREQAVEDRTAENDDEQTGPLGSRDDPQSEFPLPPEHFRAAFIASCTSCRSGSICCAA